MEAHSHNSDPFSRLGDDEAAAGAVPPGDGWQPLVPVPEHAAKLPRSLVDRVAPAGFSFGAIWKYVTAHGERAFFVARYDKPANGVPAGKQIRPFTYCRDQAGQEDWRAKAMPSGRPLYALDKLAARPDAPVLVVEGEKAADAAALLFTDYVVTTSSSGSKAAGKTDWTALRGRKVTIWPDNDAAGLAYAADVAGLLHQADVASVGTVPVPQSWPVGWDLADELPAGVDLSKLTELMALSAQQEPEFGSWENPDLSLLGTGRRPAPGFPVELLNGWGEWVEKRAAACSAPLDYVAISLLASAGAAIGNVRWPMAGANWFEPPLLWCGLVGSPSSGKSPSMDAAFALVHHAEEQMAAGYDDERRDYETKRQTAKATREAWEAEVKASVKAGENPRQMPAEAAIPDMPPRPRVRVADATIEAIAKLASSLPRGLLLVRDELSGWFGAFDKYGGGGADRAFAIEMYGGRAYVVDRVKNAEPIRIPHLSIGILGGVQPDKLADMLSGPDDGLVARMLWAWPEQLPDFSLLRELHSDHKANSAFARLVELPMSADQFGNPEPKHIQLTSEAEDFLEQYARSVAIRAHQATGVMAGALGKARGHVLRLAAVLEYLWWCIQPNDREPDKISADAVLAASGIVDGYFLPMAERVFGDASIPLNDRLAMVLIRRLRDAGGLTFNSRDLRLSKGGPLRDASAMEVACSALVESGVIRPAPDREGGTKGRSSKRFEVNGRLFRKAA
ncbi:hypothetical protein GCM10007874_11240 [Labrys miyagiensis]|uniref:DUF3987 domain-containing protein n=1 Tax=Labrys miyagiensis TaxID=346912 RepID=A0ABQ6CCL2_9HYPH|nr:DUF3987 domain-containing protein [Labrys miyagiensis]GLS18108.1 hypothetical protein GCM10007874_11240 [Labrys miyagiensis]